MKKMKKFVSLLLTVVMVLAMGMTSFAAADYSITINKVKEGETYKAYKMFDLSVDDPEDPKAYRYSLNSDWAGFKYNEAFQAAFVIGDTGFITAKAEATSEDEWVAGSVMSTLAEEAAKYAKDNDITPKDTQTAVVGKTTVTMNLGEAGYYVITSTLGTRAMIETTPDKNEVTVNEKNPEDTIVKEVKEDSTDKYGDENDAQVGDTVDFKSVTTIAPRSINVKIHDAMDSGLTLNPDSIKVYSVYDEVDEANNVEYAGATIRIDNADAGDTFTIDIPDTFAATAGNVQTLTVIYTAEVNQNAIVKDENGVAIVDQLNKTKVTFGDKSSSEEDSTRTTFHKVAIFKHAEGSETQLADAIFTLKKNDVVVNLVKLDSNNYRIVDDTETGIASTHVNDGDVATIANGAIVSDFVTVSDGNIIIWGLDSDNDYTITELQAPKGYNLLKDPVTLVWDNTNKLFTTADVVNKTGIELPHTGGIGTTIFYVLGAILVLAAGVILVTRKRMSMND